MKAVETISLFMILVPFLCAAQPIIELDSKVAEFGIIKDEKIPTSNIIVRNIGNSDLTIEYIQCPNGFIAKWPKTLK